MLWRMTCSGQEETVADVASDDCSSVHTGQWRFGVPGGACFGDGSVERAGRRSPLSYLH